MPRAKLLEIDSAPTSSSDRVRARPALAEHAASGLQRLLDVAARCLRFLGKHVDRDIVDCQRLEYVTLMGS